MHAPGAGDVPLTLRRAGGVTRSGIAKGNPSLVMIRAESEAIEHIYQLM
jgi:hypothetical protein